MSEKYKFHDPDGLYFITPTIVFWIDIFTKKHYCDIVLESIRYCQENKGLVVHAWVIMSNHMHLIISRQRNNELNEIVRDFKTYTSIEIIKAINEYNDSRKEWMLNLFAKRANELRRITNYKIWQDGNHPILLEENDMIDQRLDYLHNNPVIAGYVHEPDHFRYSSAIDYTGGKGMLEIDLII